MGETLNTDKEEKAEIKRRKFKMNENEEVVNRKEVSWNLEKRDEDNRRMITKTARFSMDEEVAVSKKIKTYNEEPLALKLEKGIFI